MSRELKSNALGLINNDTPLKDVICGLHLSAVLQSRPAGVEGITTLNNTSQ